MGVDALDIYEDALTSIFDVIQPAEGTHGQKLAFRNEVIGEISFHVPDVDARNSHLNAQYQWNSGRILANLICGTLPGISADSTVREVVNVRGKNVVELGAGTGLPSMVVAKLGAELTYATDYPDPKLLEGLSHNVDSVGGKCLPLEWGNEAHLQRILHTCPDGFDIVLCSDVLWLRSAHEKLLSTISTLTRQGSTVLIVSGLHGGSGPILHFHEKARAYGLVLRSELPYGGLWQRCATTGEELAWTAESDVEREIEERGKWNVMCILKRDTTIT